MQIEQEDDEDADDDDDDDDDDKDLDGSVGDVDDAAERIFINVGGVRHVTLLNTLSGMPGTRLSRLAKKHACAQKPEYFFDRHPGTFQTVLDFYRTGQLHVPLDVCGAVVKRELDYWGIDDTTIEACCWTTYSSYIENQKTLSDFNKNVEAEYTQLRAIDSLTGWRWQKMRIWMILDHPRSSRMAMIYAVTSFLFVCSSIAGFCAETLPAMYDPENITMRCGENNEIEYSIVNKAVPFLEYLDYICTCFFSIELIIRIMFAPNLKRFFISFMNIIDMMALLPLYVQISLDFTDAFNCLKNDRAVLETIFILRIIRIFRIFHLVKHYKALKILVHAIGASIQELLMLLIFLFIAMLVFSTLIFYAERDGGSSFDTIPIGFWWSIITMTTVGYGDVSPVTPLGYLVGAVCALCGVLLVALTIPVISNNFALFYMHARTRDEIAQKIDSRKKKEADCARAAKKAEQVELKIMGNKKGLDSRALLISMDSNSTTDESTMNLCPRGAVPPGSSPNRLLPRHTRLERSAPLVDESKM